MAGAPQAMMARFAGEPWRGGVRLFIGAAPWAWTDRKMTCPQLQVANDRDPLCMEAVPKSTRAVTVLRMTVLFLESVVVLCWSFGVRVGVGIRS